jgi:hypothetical protein
MVARRARVMFDSDRMYVGTRGRPSHAHPRQRLGTQTGSGIVYSTGQRAGRVIGGSDHRRLRPSQTRSAVTKF